MAFYLFLFQCKHNQVIIFNCFSFSILFLNVFKKYIPQEIKQFLFSLQTLTDSLDTTVSYIEAKLRCPDKICVLNVLDYTH